MLASGFVVEIKEAHGGFFLTKKGLIRKCKFMIKERTASIITMSMVLFAMLSISNMTLTSCDSRRLIATSQWKANLSQPEQNINEGCFALSNPEVLVKTCNNQEAIQISIKINSKDLQFKTLMNGLTVWIDTTGKSKKKFAIQFPQANPMPDGLPSLNPNQKDSYILNLISGVNFEGAIISCNEQEMPLNSNEATVFIDKNNALTYAITLPFKKISYNPLLNKAIGIGIVSEKKEIQHSQDEVSESGEMGSGMPGGGMGGGGMTGGGGGGMGGGMPGGGGGMPGGGMGRGGSQGMGNHSEKGKSSQETSGNIKNWIRMTLSSN